MRKKLDRVHNLSEVGSRKNRRSSGYGMAGRQRGEDILEYRTCARKRRFATELEAKKAAARASAKKDAPKITYYHCPYCDGWHLTHKHTTKRR